MTNKHTKRTLVASIIALILCISMFAGSTFAWFTDNATTGVNTIIAGTLDIDLVDANGNSLEGKTVGFVNATESTRWEPGCRYTLQEVKLVNNGNLAAKFKVDISAVEGDVKLSEVIDVYEGETKLGTLDNFLNKTIKEGVINANETLSFGTLTFVMQATAGNEYQGKSISDIAITVLATQATVENDSIDNSYDADADYKKPEVIVTEGNIVVEQSKTLTIGGGDVSAYKLISNAGGGVVINGVTYKGTAIVWGSGSLVTINGGDFTASAVVVAESESAPIIINGGTFTVDTIDAWTGADVTIYGGTFSCDPTGFVAEGRTVVENANGTFTVK